MDDQYNSAKAFSCGRHRGQYRRLSRRGGVHLTRAQYYRYVDSVEARTSSANDADARSVGERLSDPRALPESHAIAATAGGAKNVVPLLL